MKITKVQGREIYDSRGWPTVACEITLDDEVQVSASAPSGLSRGKHEARQVRDGGKRLWGMGVLKALEHIEYVIAPALINKEIDALELDLLLIGLDGTADKSHLGSNTLLATSMALYKAHAYAENLELYELLAYVYDADTVSLPFPQFNVINGGVHAYNNLHIQEFLVVPVGLTSFMQSLEIGAIVFHELKNTLQKYGKAIAFGDEGGYSSNFDNDIQALDILSETLQRVEDQEGYKCVIGLDVAASRLFDPGTRNYIWQGSAYSAQDLTGLYAELLEKYPIYSLEDPLAEDDWTGWHYLAGMLGDKAQLVGDDLFVTNVQRITRGINEQVANSVIIKPDQVGTITESLQAMKLCESQGLNAIVSHRSGETDETFIADLSVAASAGQIKAGAPRGERISKYNRLLQIEEQLASAFADE